MDTLQVSHALQQHPITGPYFAGVYASDRLPQHVPFYPCAMVWNTDPARRPGQHWVAVYIETPGGDIDYFDSYGLPPLLPSFQRFIFTNLNLEIGRQQRQRRQRGLYYHFNPVTFQGMDTSVCGHYCLFFLLLRCQRWPMTYILNALPHSTAGSSDSYVQRMTEAMFSLK